MDSVEKEEIRTLIRELHEAVQEARATKREFDTAYARAKADLITTFDDLCGAAVGAGLKRYEASIVAQIDKASNAVLHRFDTMAALLLGETKGQRARHGETLPEQIKRVTR